MLVDKDDQEFNTKYLDRKTGLSGGWSGLLIRQCVPTGPTSGLCIYLFVNP